MKPIWPALLTLAFLGTGCVGLFPEKTEDLGVKLTPSSVAFVKPNVTSRSEVLRRLGTNFVEVPANPTLQCPEAIAYTWEGGLTWHSWFAFGWPDAAPVLFDSTRGGWHAYFLTFTPDEVVMAKEFKNLDLDASVYDQLMHWAISKANSRP